MEKLNGITDAHAAEVELIRKQSALLLLKRKSSFTGELHSSGAMIENYIKALLKPHLPLGYRLCSGYIATANNFSDASNHQQHDIIIVDDRVPSIYKFGISDIEIVPAEAVCAVFEVKRELTKETVRDAMAHLEKTYLLLEEYDNGVKSKTRSHNSLASPTLSIASAAPIYGIIGLDADEKITQPDFFLPEVAPNISKFLDLIWAPAAPLVAAYRLRTSSGEQCVATMTARNQQPYLPSSFIDGITRSDDDKVVLDKREIGKVHQVALWCIRTWISNATGMPLTPEKNMKYFGLLAPDAPAQYVQS
jgi:hypothetical protein